MNAETKNTLRKLVPKPMESFGRSLKRRLTDVDCHKSYSQEGEDMILRRIFEEKLREKRPGFYVDVGAHHPKRFSNTYFFYRLAWSGINIDAMPDSMCEFRRLRPRDINLEAAFAKEPGELTYYAFDEPALNTLDVRMAQFHKDQGACRLLEERRIVTKTLGEILRRYLPAAKKVDFMSIDVEGMDLEVLQSNDWTLCRPECIISESLGSSLEDLDQNLICTFLRGQGYQPFAKTVNSMIYTQVKL